MNKLKFLVKKLIQITRSFYSRLVVSRYFHKGLRHGINLRLYGKIRFKLHPSGKVLIGDNVVLNSSWQRNTLEGNSITTISTLSSGAEIHIGSDTGLSGVTISAQKRIQIGQRVLLGAGVLVTDSDHHHVSPKPISSRRYLGLSKIEDSRDVVIEDDVFIGARAIILKGVTIGRGSVIGAGSVVVRSIPRNVVASGNPCVTRRNLNTTED